MERLYDLIHSSPVKSAPSARNCEKTVENLIDVLESNLHNGDMTAAQATMREIEQNAEERNRRLKSIS